MVWWVWCKVVVTVAWRWVGVGEEMILVIIPGVEEGGVGSWCMCEGR